MTSLADIKIIGVISFASYMVAKLAFSIGWVGWYREHIVSIARTALPKMPRGYSVREIGAAELAGLEIDSSREVQADRFAQGLSCLGVFTPAGAFAGVVWMGSGQCREGNIALNFVLPERGAWDTGMWIHPDHRMGRAFAALWAGVGEWMDARGLTHSYSMIVDYNIGSLSAHRRLGMVEVGRLLVIQIGRWQWIARGKQRWRLSRMARPITWHLPSVAATA